MFSSDNKDISKVSVNHLSSDSSIISEREESFLIEESKSGQAEAFGVLVRRYQNDLYFLALGLVSSKDEAEDLVAEAFTRAWNHIKGFRGESGFKTWLWRILINLSRSHLRRRYLQNKVFFWKKTVEDEAGPEASWVDSSAGADPERSSDTESLRQAVSVGKLTLSPREQEVFTLKYEQDMKISEIAVLLSLSQNTVKVLLFRTAKKMAKALKGYKI